MADKVCQYCGKRFPTNRGKSTHERIHCAQRPNKEEVVKTCENGCETRLLSSGDPIDRKYIEHGYSAVCINCKELYR